MTTEQALTPVLRDLRGIAPLIGDLVAQVGGLRSPAGDGIRAKADEAPLPLNATAFDDVNDLFRHLANEVVYEAAWLDQVPPVIDAWRDAAGNVVGLRAGSTPAHAHAAAAALTSWLEDRLHLLTEHALDGLLAEVRSIAKRHPFRDRAVLSKTAVCPDCTGALLVTPPRFLGDPQLVTCQTCHARLGEHEYALTEQRYAAVQARAKVLARSQGVAARLAAKYGRVMTA